MNQIKVIKNLFHMINPIWKVSPMYVIINILYTFENIPRRLLDVLIVKYIVDAAAAGEKFVTIVLTGLLFLSIEIVLVILKHIFTQIYKIPKEDEIRANIKKTIFDKIKRFDIENYDDKEFYDKYTLAFSMAENTAFNVFNTMIKFLGAIIAAATLSSYIVILSPLVIISVLIGSAVSLASNFVLNKYKVQHQKDRVIYERKIDYVNEIYSSRQNAADIRMGLVPHLLDDFFDKAYRSKIDLAKKYGKKYALFNIVFEFPLNFSDMFMWIYIAYEIIIGVLNVGDFMSISNAAWSLSQQLRNIFNVLPAFYELNLHIEDILVLDSYESKLESSLNIPIKANNNFIICIQNLSFSYQTKENQEIIKNINFEIRSGERIALVGQNGAGKSTIVKLLLRFYDPSQGIISLNGHVYNEYNLHDLRALFSAVFQDYQFYAFSIAENILLRKPQDEQDVELVCSTLKKVGLYDKIQNEPLGINTLLTKNFDNNGILLSGGEFQKLAIARAVAQNTPIVIMDEPSSALDPLSEREISNLLMEVFEDKIIFIISHRLSLTKSCDKIMVIDQGKIIEQGCHEELITQNGKYAQLWQAQSENYMDKNIS